MKAIALKNPFTMMELFIMAVFVMIFFIVKPAHAQVAQDPLPGGPADLVLKVSSAKGTYIQLAQQIAQVCPRPSMDILTADGTIALYNDLVTNKANLGFLTAPVLVIKKSIEQDPAVDRLVVVMPMYVAELHIVALRSNNNVNAFSDVGNKRIATFGGAYVTTRIILSQAQIRPFSLQDYKTELSAIQALQKGEVDVVFIEVGQPATWATELSGQQFKLVEFNRPDLLGRNGFVQTALHYPNLSQSAVKTMGSQVYMVAQNYKGAKKVNDITALRDCITKNIDEFRETTGFHSKWSEVNPNGKSDWPMFQFASTSKPKPAAKKK